MVRRQECTNLAIFICAQKPQLADRNKKKTVRVEEETKIRKIVYSRWRKNRIQERRNTQRKTYTDEEEVEVEIN